MQAAQKIKNMKNREGHRQQGDIISLLTKIMVDIKTTSRSLKPQKLEGTHRQIRTDTQTAR
jgi:tRNA(Phe) wybutosine-synthesizing methylase Tyw3